MKKLSLLLLLLLFLSACGAPSEDQIYEDVVAILETDLPLEGIPYYNISTQEMTTFTDLGEGLYKVEGKLTQTPSGVYSYVMKIKYDKDQSVRYEWTAE